MIKELPDKWIRKAIFTTFDNTTVDGKVVRVYDFRQTGKNAVSTYVLQTTQSNTVDDGNKCEYLWESNILLEVVSSFDATNNTGSRLLADNVLDALKDALAGGITLDVASGLKVLSQTMTFPNDLITVTQNKNVFRKFLRLELKIK
jgi:hypothetical protein